MKKILIIGLLVLCLAAVLPVASAATYNVTTFDEIYDIANETKNGSGKNITINFKNDIHVTGPLKMAQFEDSNVTINGNDYNFTFENVSVTGQEYFNSQMPGDLGRVMRFTYFGFRYSDVEVKNINFKDSVIKNNDSHWATVICSLGSDVVIKNCVFENLTGHNGWNVAILNFQLTDNENIVITGCEFSNISTGIGPVQLEGFTNLSKRSDGNLLIKDSIIKNNAFHGNAYPEFVNTDDRVCNLFTNVTFENLTFTNNALGALIDSGRYINESYNTGYLRDISVFNCTFEGDSFAFGMLLRGNNHGNITISNNYFANISTSFPVVVMGNVTTAEVSHNTYNVQGARYAFNSASTATETEYRFIFNTILGDDSVRTSYVVNFPEDCEEDKKHIFGNLLVKSYFSENTSQIYQSNLHVDSYDSVFGSNQLSLNGGKTKNIQLSSNESNPALNKISSADYLVVTGSTPSADKDQAGKKRIYGSGVDYGAVELHKNPILSIIDDLLNGGNNSSQDKDGSGIFSNTKPSMIEFLFGDDPFLQRSKSLLYFIYSNYVKMDLPLISPAFQTLINVLGWES